MLIINVGRLFGTVVDDRKRIHTELRHLAQLFKFAVTKNKKTHDRFFFFC